ncbi:hypothetical protein [Tenacibaculum sp. nBUS_03]|uniref:hypothetical protein n=1 Tax=Tenacibaculum sp. nBUS_03 TaxID=3395320 RepID=UPI003EB712B9
MEGNKSIEVIEEKEVLEIINTNKEYFQANFFFTDPIKKTDNKGSRSNAVMTNIDKYQTKKRLLSHYTKKISRII